MNYNYFKNLILTNETLHQNCVGVDNIEKYMTANEIERWLEDNNKVELIYDDEELENYKLKFDGCKMYNNIKELLESENYFSGIDTDLEIIKE